MSASTPMRRDRHARIQVTVPIEQLRHHVSEEEDDLFPKVTDGLNRERWRS